MAVRKPKKNLSLSKSTKTRDENFPSAKWSVIKRELSSTKYRLHSKKELHASIQTSSSPQLQALREALDCPGCEYADKVSKYMMTIDETVLKTYDTSSYPYHFINKVMRNKDICVCPLSTEPPSEEIPTFWEEISSSLRKRYYKQLGIIIGKYKKKGSQLNETETGHLDKGEVVRLAHYQLDYHIQQHYLRHRSCLTLCRDEDDLGQMQSFQLKIAAANGDWEQELKPSGQIWRDGWLNDYNRGFEQQTTFWEERGHEREKQIETARARWAYIQKLRGMQIRQMIKADADIQTFRFYLGPQLLRTIDVAKDTPQVQEDLQIQARCYANMMGDSYSSSGS
ncbi:hypothetical protein PENANT_c004G07506 [Penicillium antarcticum]|uniref:Uncharacterized protein n=1 Tax=Penicillium antarcticum TaxID=416450 RepID=A0A1V6QG35_9EURO|nr:uncharacterized protein N7508_002307 [Penicillium antarcticum]KAJ5317799.1 hypothetical protein N7508_002307 [Penicillium antarcticum]OQD88174.1 hypothetical protein PENANT_c004G07506 [Penicillium antarcticum]